MMPIHFFYTDIPLFSFKMLERIYHPEYTRNMYEYIYSSIVILTDLIGYYNGKEYIIPKDTIIDDNTISFKEGEEYDYLSIIIEESDMLFEVRVKI